MGAGGSRGGWGSCRQRVHRECMYTNKPRGTPWNCDCGPGSKAGIITNVTPRPYTTPPHTYTTPQHTYTHTFPPISRLSFQKHEPHKDYDWQDAVVEGKGHQEVGKGVPKGGETWPWWRGVRPPGWLWNQRGYPAQSSAVNGQAKVNQGVPKRVSTEITASTWPR